ncbi:circadian clock protein KaiC [Thiohalophilus thiocyanatoxydans]|uniref:non-specific serine/threonine protein kinase n=1 Tax=Thiohalophilus thiocyanatoxydans TaxID=381308 RepID=A0A4R8INY4_9GAMM|nr:circadian clock protein KaiC [Thiohalophilus thiocyanatoxydans]TDX98177.1 circadian clock protein KaiC [Thiohalophilus thiocyanatoxydans]
MQSTHYLHLKKIPTGITGLDEITDGGLPSNRPTLVCGNAGCGKTLLGMQFLVKGALERGEPGVFISFEEVGEDLAVNVSSLGYDLPELINNKQLYIDHVDLQGTQLEQGGDYDLEGLFIRLGAAIDKIGAKRVVLDTIDVLFAQLPDPRRLRSELRRLFSWLKQKDVTAIVTAEAGEHTLTRHGIEEYVSDCVIALDHRVQNQLSSRRLRVVKYRGSSHGTNEYPFLIGKQGISILPVTSLTLLHAALEERITTGITGLDEMLGGKGYYRGSSILASGTAGSGKSSFAAHLAQVSVKRGEKVLYFAYEESPAQICRNMASIGIDLGHWLDKGLLQIHAVRPTAAGLEAHLLGILEVVREFEPQTVVIDPLNSFITGGDTGAIKVMLARLLDYLKTEGITAFCNSLTQGGENEEQTEIGISSLMDTWLLLRNTELEKSRSHTVTIIKSRGMSHSNAIHDYHITDQGVIINSDASST